MTNKLPKTSRSLPIALLRARERVMGPIRDMLADVDITEQQWRVLRVLCEDGPQEPTRIADKACLLLPSLTRILQNLENKQMIEREVDQRDRRKQIVSATARGERIIAENIGRSVEQMAALQERLGQEKYEQLLDLLNELVELDKT